MRFPIRRSRRSTSAGAVLLVFVMLACGGAIPLQGCGGGSSTTNLLLNIVILLITRAAGGTVTDHNASLVIPPDSLAMDTTIKVQPAASLPAAPAGLVLIPGTAYAYGPAGTTFSPPATLTISYNPATVPTLTQPASFALYMVSGGSYVSVTGSVVNTSAHTVSAPVLQLDTYAVLGVTPVQDPPQSR